MLKALEGIDLYYRVSWQLNSRSYQTESLMGSFCNRLAPLLNPNFGGQLTGTLKTFQDDHASFQLESFKVNTGLHLVKPLSHQRNRF